ncbi:(2Fe-2S)-binding protein [Streptomyces lunalinharesii]|uniref:Ferric siderophore reductase C-terminal domain-containing protein n=1 Tax=Streptomyces lunalinharesii TaxID=333384 RepID=A0ABP6E7J6_9ACTN
MPQESMTAILNRSAAVGPFFAVRTDAGAPREHGFLPLGELYGESSAPALRTRVAAVATRLGVTEPRIAASLVYQGLAGRLWSIALAPAVLAGRVPDLGGGALWWHPDRSTPDELWLPSPSPSPAPSPTPSTLASASGEELASGLRAAVLHGHLMPLHRAVGAVTPISSRLLWGNAASALVGTLRVLEGWCRGAGRGEVAERAVALAAAVLEDPLLRDTGTLDPAGPAFSRRSCCLYYRVPGGGLCGDCVLRRTRR